MTALQQTLVENGALVPGPEPLSSRMRSRDREIGTKALTFSPGCVTNRDKTVPTWQRAVPRLSETFIPGSSHAPGPKGHDVAARSAASVRAF